MIHAATDNLYSFSNASAFYNNTLTHFKHDLSAPITVGPRQLYVRHCGFQLNFQGLRACSKARDDLPDLMVQWAWTGKHSKYPVNRRLFTMADHQPGRHESEVGSLYHAEFGYDPHHMLVVLQRAFPSDLHIELKNNTVLSLSPSSSFRQKRPLRHRVPMEMDIEPCFLLLIRKELRKENILRWDEEHQVELAQGTWLCPQGEKEAEDVTWGPDHLERYRSSITPPLSNRDFYEIVCLWGETILDLELLQAHSYPKVMALECSQIRNLIFPHLAGWTALPSTLSHHRHQPTSTLTFIHYFPSHVGFPAQTGQLNHLEYRFVNAFTRERLRLERGPPSYVHAQLKPISMGEKREGGGGNEWTTAFCLTLRSDEHLMPNHSNSNAHWRHVLPFPITLEEKFEWQVGVASLTLPLDFVTFPFTLPIWVVVGKQYMYRFTVPPNLMFTTREHLVRALNRALKWQWSQGKVIFSPQASHLQNDPDFEPKLPLVMKVVNGCLELQNCVHESLQISMDMDLWRCLGGTLLPNEIKRYTMNHEEKYVLTLRAQQTLTFLQKINLFLFRPQFLCMYTSLIQPNFVGQHRLPLLCILPVPSYKDSQCHPGEGSYGNIVIHEVQYSSCHPQALTNFECSLRTPAGDLAPFHHPGNKSLPIFMTFIFRQRARRGT